MHDNVRVIVQGSFCEQPPLALILTLEKSGCYIVDDDYQLGLKTIDGAIEVAPQLEAPELFTAGGSRRSDFFRDLAGAAYMAGAERLAERDGVPFDRVLSLYDRAILNVETRLMPHTFEDLLRRAAARVRTADGDGNGDGNGNGDGDGTDHLLRQVVDAVLAEPIEELSFVGTGYGRQTLPFPKQAIRSEILCHGAHRFFPGTRTVLDIGGQDTKAIQVDEAGVVTSFQMNDRCAAGCGRYLGYIADELNLGLHELGPLALQARKSVRVNSTCTVFAGAELRERLALGQRREDILAGLHRAIMLRSMSLLARSGGVTINAHPDSIYMGALGAGLFARADLEAGKPSGLPTFAETEAAPA